MDLKRLIYYKPVERKVLRLGHCIHWLTATASEVCCLLLRSLSWLDGVETQHLHVILCGAIVLCDFIFAVLERVRGSLFGQGDCADGSLGSGGVQWVSGRCHCV